jgi:hypothetical protein
MRLSNFSGAGAVVDHELPAELLGEFLRHLARRNVAAAARRKWHDHAHGLGRIGLRGRVE